MATALTFVVKQADGGMLGPVSFATLKDLFMTGHVPADALVSRDQKTFVPIAKLKELQPFVAQNQAAKTQVPSYSGFFTDNSFLRVFYRLAIAKETGRMLVARGDARKEIYLVDGNPVFVGSNLLEERIGEFLVARGTITRPQLEDALVIVGNHGNHIGNTLMAMKVISPHAFYEHLVAQLRLKVMKLVEWSDGRYDFFKGTLYEGPKLPVSLDALDILSEAVRSFLSRKAVEERLATRMHQPILHAKKKPISPEALGLSGFEQKIYENMNDMRTPADLAEEYPGDDQGRTALATAYFMLEIGMAEPVV